jgi:hypothetical protein
MRDSWYYAVPEGQIGPITLQELKETLPNLPNAKDVYIWHDSLPDWIRAGDLAEIVANARMGAPQGGRSFDPCWGAGFFISVSPAWWHGRRANLDFQARWSTHRQVRCCSSLDSSSW